MQNVAILIKPVFNKNHKQYHYKMFQKKCLFKYKNTILGQNRCF